MNALYRTENGFIVCCVCGDQFSEIHKLYPHIGKHMDAPAQNGDNKGFSVLLRPHLAPIGFMWVVDKFPQLCLINPTNVEMFIRKLEIICFDNKTTIYGINNLFDHLSSIDQDLRRDVINIITAANYQCGLCGGVYDCGLPSVEIAAKHSLKCYANLNRPNIK